jgi:hypothetical protein
MFFLRHFPVRSAEKQSKLLAMKKERLTHFLLTGFGNLLGIPFTTKERLTTTSSIE